MPEKKTVERARHAKREGKAPSTQAGEFVREEIHHIREGKHGARSAKQAIAIGLSKARQAGVDVPQAPRGSASAKRSNSRTRKKAKKSPRRSKAVKQALKREPRRAASREALSKQARSAAGRRSAADRSRAAKKGAKTKGRSGRSQAAKKAAKTRSGQ